MRERSQISAGEEILPMNTIPEQLLAFIEKSPDCFHAVAAMKEELAANGFRELEENEK